VIPGPFYEEGNRARERFRAMKYFHPGHRLEAIVRAERDRAKPPRQAGNAQESPAEEQGPQPPGRRGQGLRFTHAIRTTQYDRRNPVAFRAGNGRIAGCSGAGGCGFGGRKRPSEKSEDFFRFFLDRGLTRSDLCVE